jgi:ComF family protein
VAGLLQSAVRAVYPPQCVSCGALTESEFGLCGPCWRQTHFIGGLTCGHCGLPLPGEDRGEQVLCDDCMVTARPWDRGGAVFLYRDTGRSLVLALKHGDRTDLARALGDWMATRAGLLLRPEAVIVPVPLHWFRLLRRRYNQAALLAQRIGAVTGVQVVPDALVRPRATKALDGHSKDARFAALGGAIRPHPKRRAMLKGRQVLLVDDVMTTGATLAACTDALRAAGAGDVSVLVLARVTKDR